MSEWEILQKSINAFQAILWPAATALAAVGIVSMATIEIVKALFKPRGAFQKRIFLERLNECAEKHGANVHLAHKNIINLATAGDEEALFELQSAKFTGQINAAAQVAITYPAFYPDIIKILAFQAEFEDIERVLNEPPSPESHDYKDYMASRNRVLNLIQRHLDALQISNESQWTQRLQIAAVAVSSAYILAAAIWYHTATPGTLTPKQIITWVIIAVIGGMVAPIARDLVSSLKKIKDRAR